MCCVELSCVVYSIQTIAEPSSEPVRRYGSPLRDALILFTNLNNNNNISSEGGGATLEIGRVSSLAAMGAASPLAIQLSGRNSRLLVDEDAPVSDLISYWESKEH